MMHDFPTVLAAGGNWTAPSPLGLNPAGYAAESGVLNQQHRPLEVNALKVSVESEQVLLLSFDFLYVGDTMRRLLEEELAAVISPDKLFTAASHTHFGPQIQSGRESLGAFSEEYFSVMSGGLVEFLVELIDQKGEEVEILIGDGFHRAGTRRRRIELSRRGLSVQMGPSRFSTPLPHTHLSFRSVSDGKPMAHLWSTPMHATSYYDGLTISPDFPGEIRHRFREKLQTDIPVLFFQGFSGDQRPSSPLEFLGKRKVRFAPFKEEEWHHWIQQLWLDIEDVALAKERVDFIEAARFVFDPARIFFFEPGEEEAAAEQAAAHCVRIGATIRFVALPFEVSFGWTAKLVRKSEKVLGIGCSDGVLGYLPTRLQNILGGYEARSSQQYFGIRKLRAGFATHVGKLLNRALAYGQKGPWEE